MCYLFAWDYSTLESPFEVVPINANVMSILHTCVISYLVGS